MNFLQLSSTLRITFVLVTLVRDGEELLLLGKKEIKDRARIHKSKVLSGMTRLQLYFLYLPKYTGKKNKSERLQFNICTKHGASVLLSGTEHF